MSTVLSDEIKLVKHSEDREPRAGCRRSDATCHTSTVYLTLGVHVNLSVPRFPSLEMGP